MQWYVVHTKPRKEWCALQNLERQGYECFLPTLRTEKLRRGALTVVEEPLFTRYLFIRLGTGPSAKAWGPVRNTVGVSRLVCFGAQPARVDDELIGYLQARQASAAHEVQPLFAPGERVQITAGPFAGIEAVFQMTDGERRALVLIELLSKPVPLCVEPSALCKVG